MEKKVKFTNNVPICPHCDEPTERTQGMSSTTCMYFPPRYDENGINVNPDRNITTTNWKCNKCNQDYFVIGNYTGYVYR